MKRALPEGVTTAHWWNIDPFMNYTGLTQLAVEMGEHRNRRFFGGGPPDRSGTDAR